MSSDTFEITAFQRMLSACAGSIINSLAVTPFDVVRIRLQQQQLLDTASAVLMPKNCCRTQTVFWLSPIDCSHPCANVESATVRLTGTWQGLKFIGLNEGVSTLWRGVSLALFIAIPANMVYFAGYDHLKNHSAIGKQLSPALSPLIAGAFARTLAVITIAPIELVKTRLQAMPADKSNKKALFNLLSDTKRMVQHSGISSLFKGLQLTLWRDVPFSAIYWLSYEHFKKKFASLGQQFRNTFETASVGAKRSSNDVALVSFLSGSVSGAIAAICTNPFDVGKTRLQVCVDSSAGNSSCPSSSPQALATVKSTGLKPGRNTLMSASSTSAQPASKIAEALKASKQRPSMFRFLTDIAKDEGVGALYVGLVPRILKIAPSCAVMISSYEISKNYFYNRSIESKESKGGSGDSGAPLSTSFKPLGGIHNNNSKLD